MGGIGCMCSSSVILRLEGISPSDFRGNEYLNIDLDAGNNHCSHGQTRSEHGGEYDPSKNTRK